MQIVLGLCIPAVWLWGISLAVIVREYFSDVMYMDFSMFITIAPLIFPAISLAVTVVLLRTMLVIKHRDRG